MEQLNSLLGTAPAHEGSPTLFHKASWGIDVMNNRVVVYTDDETVKELVLQQHFEKDLILFQGALIVTEQ